MSIICIYLCLICLTISQVKNQDAPSNEAPEANEIESPIVPSPPALPPTAPPPTAPPPTAPSPAVPSTSAPPLTAQSPTVPSPTAPPPTASPPTAPSPAAPSPTAPSPTTPSPALPSPIVPYPTVPSPTATPPAASSPTTPSPTLSPVTAPSPTVPPTAIPSLTVPSATTPSPSALSPIAPSPIAPSLTTPSSTTSPSRATSAIAKVGFADSASDAIAAGPDGNSGETTLGDGPGNVAPNTGDNEQSTAATSADTRPDASTTAAVAPSSDGAGVPSEGATEPEPDKTSTAATAPTTESTTTRATDDVVTTTCKDNATETTTAMDKTTKAGANDAGVCTLTDSIKTTKTIPRPVPATNTKAPHSGTSTTARGHGLFAGDMPVESTTKVYTEEDLEWAHVRQYDWIIEYLRSLARRFPKTTKLQEIGRSKGDLPIYAIEMTHKMHSGATIVIDAAMNGKDIHSVSFATFILHKLIERLNENLLTLTGVKIIIIPIVNPDNYKRFTENTDTEPCRETMFMNFDVGVPPPPSSSCSGTFFSEPESRAIRDYFTQLTKLKLYISLASSKRVIAFPYGYRTGISRKSSSMAENMKEVIDSKDPTEAKVITTNLNAGFDGISGTPVDWAYDTLNVHYALNVHLPKDESDYEFLEVMYAYYEAIRYAVLQIQLTDSEVALAIYEDFKESSAPVIRNKTFILPVILILICLK